MASRYIPNISFPNTSFTYETKSDNKLSFLDVTVEKEHDSFSTSVFRKNTFTGLGTSYFSFCNFQFKINSIMTLLHRAYSISSSFYHRHSELQLLFNYFHSNGYPIPLIKSKFNQISIRKLATPTLVPTVDKKQMFLSITYFGQQSEKLKLEVTSLVSKFFPHLNLRIILSNKLTIGSFFRFKDKIPAELCHSVVYKFRCAQCASEYVGSTIRPLYVRVAEHSGRSPRTNNLVSQPKISAIRDHAIRLAHSLSIDNFTILGSNPSEYNLRILESIFIYKSKPKLNNTQSAVPLVIVNR